MVVEVSVEYQTIFSKGTTLKRYASHTRCRVMAFSVRYYSNTDKHSIYIFGVNLNQENNNSGLSPLQYFDISLFNNPQKKITDVECITSTCHRVVFVLDSIMISKWFLYISLTREIWDSLQMCYRKKI